MASLVVLLVLLARCGAQFIDCPVGADVWEKTFPGPPTPVDQPAWLANLVATRASLRAKWNYSSIVYDTILPWTERMYMGPQSHIYDKYLFDADAGIFTVNRFLDDLAARYGDIDFVLLWGTYTNLGIDERNQFQMAFEDIPGGRSSWRDIIIPAFHARGVRVGAPYNP